MTRPALLLIATLLAGCHSLPAPQPDALPSWVDPETTLEDQCFDARSELDGFGEQLSDGTPLNSEDRAERALTERFVAERCG
jgi:hypothetical protein